ncbi:hypothetical protein [Thauera sp.]
MAIENLTTTTDCERVNELFRALAILDGLEARTEAEEDPEGVFTNIRYMSTTAQQIIRGVIGTLNP